MIQIIAQTVLHLVEPFLHRYIIRGTFSQSDSQGWHSAFVWLWIAIYLFVSVMAHLSLGEMGMMLLRGMALRFVAQSILLNWLMVQDGHQGRTWHDLRSTGVDGFVQKVMRYPVAWVFKKDSDIVLTRTTEKVTILAGVLLTIYILTL